MSKPTLEIFVKSCKEIGGVARRGKLHTEKISLEGMEMESLEMAHCTLERSEPIPTPEAGMHEIDNLFPKTTIIYTPMAAVLEPQVRIQDQDSTAELYELQEIDTIGKEGTKQMALTTRSRSRLKVSKEGITDISLQ